MNNGKIIAICGLDGVGKTTQINYLLEKLKQEGAQIKFYRVRIGFTPWIQKIKTIMKSTVEDANKDSQKKHTTNPKKLSKHKAKQLTKELYRIVSLLDLIRHLLLIRLASRKNVIIICDRYLWDNYIIHKDKYPNIDLGSSWLWKASVAAAQQPAISLLMDMPVKESFQRNMDRNNGITEESLETLNSRKQIYLDVIQQAEWHIVNASPPPQQVFQEIWQRVKPIILPVTD